MMAKVVASNGNRKRIGSPLVTVDERYARSGSLIQFNFSSAI